MLWRQAKTFVTGEINKIDLYTVGQFDISDVNVLRILSGCELLKVKQYYHSKVEGISKTVFREKCCFKVKTWNQFSTGKDSFSIFLSILINLYFLELKFI